MDDKPEGIVIAALKQYAPKPSQRFYRRMASAPWNRKPHSLFALPARRLALGAVVLLVIVAAFAFSIPTVRASIVAFLGLGRSTSDTVPNPPIPAESLVDSQQVDEISQLAGWTVQVPTWVPSGYKFSSAMYDSSNEMVLLSFMATRQLPGDDPTMTETKAMTMIQAMHNDVLLLMVAPSTDAQDITVNGQPAAYAVGAWENDATKGQATWNNEYPLQNVYWQIDAVFLSLNTNDTQVSKADLLKMAASTR